MANDDEDEEDEAECFTLCSSKIFCIVDEIVFEPCALVCILLLTTSVGTRTKHAATSPILAAAICDTAKFPSNKPYFSCNDIDNGLALSYTLKNNAAPGALPKAVAPKPRYIPLNPPAFKKPWDDCRRVLIVSIGNKALYVYDDDG